MKKKIFVLALLAVSFISSFLFFQHCSTVKNQGTIIPWQPVEFTYKDYTGSPSIDSPEFYEVVKQKTKNGECRRILSKYTDYPMNEVKELAKTDTDAMLEMFARGQYTGLTNDEINGYLLKAYELGNINALLIVNILPPIKDLKN